MSEYTSPPPDIVAGYEAQLPLFREIKTKGGIQNYFHTYWSPISGAFRQSGGRALGCMDEGEINAQAHTAGSGILLGINEATEMFTAKGLTGIFSHELCGAANLHAQVLGRPQDADQMAREFSQELARRLHIPYLGHTPASVLNRPTSGHDARIVYVDTTGNFNYAAVANIIPKGFQISAGGLLTPEQTLSDVNLAMDIILGSHGLGSIITTDNPIWIVPLGTEDKIGPTAVNLQSAVARSQGRAVLKPVVLPSI